MTNQQGAAAIVVVMIMLAIALLVVAATALTGLDDLDIGVGSQESGDLLLFAESCNEEALLQLSRDNTYTGSSITVGNASCTISVTGTPCGSCVITAEATDGMYTRTIETGVDVSGSSVDITSWEEAF